MKKVYLCMSLLFLGFSIRAQDNFIAEIRIFAGNFAPKGWAFCDGQIMSISQNTALFSLLGTTYGGDGKSNFALPNLNGRVPIGAGGGPGLTPRYLGEEGGSDYITLLLSEIPLHLHAINNGSVPAPAFDGSGNSDSPVNSYPANSVKAYGPIAKATKNSAGTLVEVSSAGGSQPHNNLQPYLTVRYIIALQGIFPPRS